MLKMKLGKIACTTLAIVFYFGFAGIAQAQDEATAAALYNEGLEKIKAEEFQAALPLLQQAVDVADPAADAEVIKLAKKNGTIAGYKAGNDLRKAKQYDEALKAYDMGIAFNKTFYANYIGRAQALEGMGDNTEAVKAYLKAAEVSKLNKKEDKVEQMEAKAENMVAVSFGDKKWEETMALGAAFLESKESPEVHYYLGQALKESGDATKAAEHAQKAIDQATGEKSKYFMLLAESFEATNQSEKAIEAYKQVTDSKYADRAQYKINELSGGK